MIQFTVRKEKINFNEINAVEISDQKTVALL